MLWRAFDKTVRRKPLAFAADAVYGNSIDSGLEVIAKKGVARNALLLMFVNVLLLAFTPVMVRRGSSSFKRRSFKRRYACTYTRGSVRRASGFVLTGYTEVMGQFSARYESRNLSFWDGWPNRSRAPCAGTRCHRRRHAVPPILRRSWTYASQEMAPHLVRPGAAVAKSRSR